MRIPLFFALLCLCFLFLTCPILPAGEAAGTDVVDLTQAPGAGQAPAQGNASWRQQNIGPVVQLLKQQVEKLEALDSLYPGQFTGKLNSLKEDISLLESDQIDIGTTWTSLTTPSEWFKLHFVETDAKAYVWPGTRTIWVYEKNFNTLTPEEKASVLLHELNHIKGGGEKEAYTRQYEYLRLIGKTDEPGANLSSEMTSVLDNLAQLGVIPKAAGWGEPFKKDGLDRSLGLDAIYPIIKNGLEDASLKYQKKYADLEKAVTGLPSDPGLLDDVQKVEDWRKQNIERLTGMKETDPAKAANRDECLARAEAIHSNNEKFLCSGCNNVVQHWWFPSDEYLGPHWQCPLCESVTQVANLLRPDGKTYRQYASERNKYYDDLIAQVNSLADEKIKEVMESANKKVNHEPFAGYVDYAPKGPQGQVKAGEQVRFWTNPADPDGDALSYTWFVDGSPAASGSYSQPGQEVSFVTSFAQPGGHEVVCRVTDPGGLSSENSATFTVYAERGAVDASQYGKITINVDGRVVDSDVPPQVINGRTMVPVRFVAQALNCRVDWDDATQTVVITSPGSYIATPPPNNSSQIRIMVDGTLINPDVPPLLINGRTMVPVRFVAEAMGARVEWNDATQTVVIDSGAGTSTGAGTVVNPPLVGPFIDQETQILLEKRTDAGGREVYVPTDRSQLPVKAGAPVINASVLLENASAGQKVRAVLEYNHGQASLTSEDLVLPKSGSGYVGFSFTRSTAEWPVGYYEIKIYLDGVLKATTPFEVVPEDGTNALGG